MLLTAAVVVYALQFVHALQHGECAACRARPAEYRIELAEAMIRAVSIGGELVVLLQQAVQLDALIDVIQIAGRPEGVIRAGFNGLGGAVAHGCMPQAGTVEERDRERMRQ